MTPVIAVTGGTGFVGGPLVRSLVDAGYEVHSLSSGIGPSQEGIHHHRFDLLTGPVDEVLNEIRAPTLVHCAWVTATGYMTAPANLSWAEASLRLLRAFASAGGQRFVGVGSGAEYWPITGPCAEETSPTEPVSLYGRSKLAVYEVAAAAEAILGLELAWARVFWTYGPGQPEDRLVPFVCRALLEGRQARCGPGNVLRDYLHISDVANGLQQLVSSSIRGSVNICSGQAVSVSEIALTLGELLGRPELVRFDSIGSDGTPASVIGENGRLRSIGWRQRVQFREGLADTTEWYTDRQ